MCQPIHWIQSEKYIGGGDREPRLNRLGGKEWENTKKVE